ncbi:MAG: hypothetical protein ACRDP4_09650, partial [Nocardioidaceae bacterium]
DASARGWRGGRPCSAQAAHHCRRRALSGLRAYGSVAGWLGGQLAFGIFGLVLMSVVGVALLVARRRSATVKFLLDGRDERVRGIDVKATAFAGACVMLVALGAFIVELARGEDAAQFAWLCAVGGLAYVVALVFLVVRR